MVHVKTKLKSHDIDLNENFIVSHALSYLSVDFTQIKTAYNTFDDKWNVNNLITKCVVEEEKLKKERSDLTILPVHAKPHSDKKSWKNKKNTYNALHRHPKFRKPGNGQHHNVGGHKPNDFKKFFLCFWCKEKRHKRIDCHALKSWLDNKNIYGGVHKPTETKLEEKQAHGKKIVESMHAKFLELDVVEPVITYDNIDYVTLDVVTFPLPIFDNARSSTIRGGLTTNENVAEHPIENVIEPLVDNIVDPPIVDEVAQPAEPVEQIDVRRSVRQKETCYH
ncbi:hypothetical protein KIW84_071266 [Lathyrus oleraceus]|uniref:Uncharacterized protein n=1 Tax=Pisum sativum TaxID=3888 RepID=A0A9D4VK82_PEA|nr:hypothetical protein KIW84_071266 [Pisum sativum]